MKLVYFTSSYPYGLGERWKLYELENFKRYFSEITVVPFSYAGNKRPAELLEGINYLKPLFEEGLVAGTSEKFKKILFSRHARIFLKEFMAGRCFSNRSRFISWLDSSYLIVRLERHANIQELMQQSDNKTIWYFFWGRESSEIAAVLRGTRLKMAARFHRFDLYKYINNGFIPFQGEQIKNLHLLLPCSQDGADYLRGVDAAAADKTYVARLGARFAGRSTLKDDGILKILSCSTVEPVKRVELIAEAMHYVTVPVQWTHLGSGSLFPRLKEKVNAINNPDVSVDLKGKVPSRDILPYYVQNHFDLFLNVSTSEGVPVSIMEAFSCGIPALATDVGGTKEIVDNEVGALLNVNITAKELAARLDDYARQPLPQKMQQRDNAYARFCERCDADKNADSLAQQLQLLLK